MRASSRSFRAPASEEQKEGGERAEGGHVGRGGVGKWLVSGLPGVVEGGLGGEDGAEAEGHPGLGNPGHHRIRRHRAQPLSPYRLREEGRASKVGQDSAAAQAEASANEAAGRDEAAWRMTVWTKRTAGPERSMPRAASSLEYSSVGDTVPA